jgi:hypothetical protein
VVGGGGGAGGESGRLAGRPEPGPKCRDRNPRNSPSNSLLVYRRRDRNPSCYPSNRVTVYRRRAWDGDVLALARLARRRVTCGGAGVWAGGGAGGLQASAGGRAHAWGQFDAAAQRRDVADLLAAAAARRRRRLADSC